MSELKIAVLPGDGIGQEVMAAALAVLDRLERRFGFALAREPMPGGAAYWRDTGRELPQGAMAACREAAAILFGAMGLPEVRYPDGTEIAPHLDMRREFGLVAGIRPVRRLPNTSSPLRDPRAATLDLVVLRESSEGLFASRGRGILVNDRVATETMVITRETTEQLCDEAFALAARRTAQGRGRGRVTCVDKSNVFVAMAFFRKIFDERAARHPQLTADHAYVDATALDLVRKPWELDVLVMENMFGDILSDLAGGLVGGMGLAPCAEIGRDHALFQPAHGSAPDIAGQGVANPTAMLLSTAMMLDWLAARHARPRLAEAAAALEAAIDRTYAEGVLPRELGGAAGTAELTRAVVERLG